MSTLSYNAMIVFFIIQELSKDHTFPGFSYCKYFLCDGYYAIGKYYKYAALFQPKVVFSFCNFFIIKNMSIGLEDEVGNDLLC